MKLTRSQIQKAIKSKSWQKFRISLKGLPTNEKLEKLTQWLVDHNNSKMAQIQTTNYVNALKRGGLI